MTTVAALEFLRFEGELAVLEAVTRGVAERAGDVEVEGVAVLVLFALPYRLDAGGYEVRVVCANAGATGTAEHVAEGAVAEEVYCFVG